MKKIFFTFKPHNSNKKEFLPNQHNRIDRDLFFPNLLIILISVFYLTNVNSGHDWGGDFSMYIMNANNIVSWQPYSQTGYIYNNEVVYGPAAYPPIYPLLLSPILFVFGVNLFLLKLPAVFCFIFSLFFLNIYLYTKDISLYKRIFFLALVGIYPYFFLLSESIMSDFPFLFFCVLSLMLIDNQLKFKIVESKNFYIYLFTGFSIYLAYGTRSLGLVLLPVLFFYSLVKAKKITIGTFISLFVAILLILIQNYFIPQTGDYIDYAPDTISNLVSTVINSVFYYFSLFYDIFHVNNLFLGGIFFLILVEAFTLGFILHIRKGVSSYDLFFIIYLSALLVWPSYQYLRFLVPIIPFYFLYIIEGFDFIIKKINIRIVRIIIPVILLGFITFNYTKTYVDIFPRPISAIEKTETQEMFQFIKAESKEADVILFFKPRVLALFTDRKSLAMRFPDPEGDAIGKMKSFGVDYVILNKNHMFEYQPELKLFIYSNPQYFDLIFENLDFNIYKVLY